MRNIITLCATACLFVLSAIFCSKTAGNSYLFTAEETAEWIISTSVESGEYIFWPSQPDTMQRGEISLYHGVPGGILFFIELYKATNNIEYLTEAEKAAGWLAEKSVVNPEGAYWSDYENSEGRIPDPGLYSGTSGVGTTFLELANCTKKQEYFDYAKKAADWLTANTKQFDSGESWSEITDIVSGAAGTGLFLVKAAEELGDPSYLQTAEKAGRYLISQAVPEDSGKKWKIFPDYTRVYPNFSHGTAGVAYFLAVLYQKTEKREFLNAAMEGAEWLIEHEGEHTAEGHAWFHHEPDGRDLYYVSWCHGPGGTARLFYQLYLITGEEKWLESVKESAKWLMNCGLTNREPEGFWNNVSACCGDAGIADFFADLYKITGDKEYWDWAVLMTQSLTDNASPGNPGKKWIQAENRTRPEEVYAQTGLMQGASGIGLLYLKMHAFSIDTPPFRVLSMPDSPFNKQ